ncbi:MAG: hypothetical protein R3B59_06780 [Dehalococcoidia bacterium]
MYRTVGVAAVVAALALVLVMGARAPREVEAASLSVFSSADSGPGTFRAAVEAANANPSITKIVLRNWLPITLTSTVTYTGSQPLTVQGDSPLFNRVIEGDGACARFKSTSGGDITFQRVTMRDLSCDLALEAAVHIEPPADAGEVVVQLDRVVVENVMADIGIRLDEAAASGTSFSLQVTGSRIDGCDLVCVLVDERGTGGVVASFSTTTVRGAGERGVAVSEQDSGDVSFSASGSQFNENNNAGVEVLAGGSGDLEVTLNGIGASNNGTSGVALQQGGEGDFDLTGTYLRLEGNGSSGLYTTESGDGDFSAWLSGVEATGNSNHNMLLQENDEGDGDFRVSGSTLNDSEIGTGLTAVEFGSGTLSLWVSGLTANDNHQDGLVALQAAEGDLALTTLLSRFEGNDGAGVFASDLGSGSLRFTVSASRATGNAEDGFSFAEALEGAVEGTFSSSVAWDNGSYGYHLVEGDDGPLDVTYSLSSAVGNSTGGTFASADGDVGQIHEFASAVGPYDLTNVVVGP